jgi:hypothetical protein
LKAGQVQPFTGLAAGFMKSIARELPGAMCKSLITDSADPKTALSHLAAEIGVAQAGIVEVCYDGEARRIFRLVPVQEVTLDRRPYIDHGSVVIATAAAGVVTALMAEEMLQRIRLHRRVARKNRSVGDTPRRPRDGPAAIRGVRSRVLSRDGGARPQP